MFQPHQVGWVGVSFLGCVILAGTLALLAQFGKLKLSKSVFSLFAVLAFLQLFALGLVWLSDDAHLRRELIGIDPLSVSNLVIRPDGGRREIVAPAEVKMLFNQLQRVAAVPAHHSHPLSSNEFEFMIGGNRYRYRIGQDSARADEYWVFETARAGEPGREIGRITSPNLGQVLNALVRGELSRQR